MDILKIILKCAQNKTKHRLLYKKCNHTFEKLTCCCLKWKLLHFCMLLIHLSILETILNLTKFGSQRFTIFKIAFFALFLLTYFNIQNEHNKTYYIRIWTRTSEHLNMWFTFIRDLSNIHWEVITLKFRQVSLTQIHVLDLEADVHIMNFKITIYTHLQERIWLQVIHTKYAIQTVLWTSMLYGMVREGCVCTWNKISIIYKECCTLVMFSHYNVPCFCLGNQSPFQDAVNLLSVSTT